MINFFQLVKNFLTSQKGRMKTPDFRPTLKANEMALCLYRWLLDLVIAASMPNPPLEHEKANIVEGK